MQSFGWRSIQRCECRRLAALVFFGGAGDVNFFTHAALLRALFCTVCRLQALVDSPILATVFTESNDVYHLI